METRSSRHRKRKHQRKPAKLFIWIAAAAAISFTIGFGGAFLSSRSSSSTEDPESLQAAAGIDAPKPTVTPQASAVPSKPSAAPQPLKGDQIKLTFIGDVLLGSTVENVLKQYGYDYPYTSVKPYLQKADYTIANLETPITEKGVEQKKDYVYRSSPLALPALVDSGIDLVNLANNHVMDYGQEGLLDTMKHVDQSGLKRIGVGKDIDEAYRPVIVEKQGIKTAFLGFSRVVPEQSWKAGKGHPGVAESYNYKLPVEAIQKARKEADLVVVIAHWGIEREDHPDKNQKELAHRYIDAGADLVVASHPHVLQGFESYKGKWIAYSLGNFIFTTNEISKTWDSAILEASCTRERRCNLSVVPVLTKWAKPEIMNAEEGRKLLKRLSQISIHAKVTEEGQVIPEEIKTGR